MDRLLNVDQVSKILNLAPVTIYKYVSAGKISYLKIGRRLLFKTEQLQEWIDNHIIQARNG